MILLLDSAFSEQQLEGSAELDLRNISIKVWPTLLSKCTATNLRLYHLKLSSLEGIDSLINTRELALEWATKIESLMPVFKLQNLTHLSVSDFPKLRNIDGIHELHELVELNLSGNLGGGSSPLRLSSIEPVSQLPKLTKLSLLNIKLETNDITSLARCSQLRNLRLSNQFERSQVAFLASRLNEQLIEPLTAYTDTHINCEKCNGLKSMFTGRRMPFLCRLCDTARFEKLTREFKQMALNS
ncbi:MULTISPECIES: internalin G [Pseudomonas]|uniref:Internalin G n=1 Tax=Pseudomonas fulva TaxID=47880 RepID=A0A0D0K2R6_9PSED|nr:MULTISPECIES: internalin G [Pseudomonas]KIQ02633.1 internalin G [Pseudomonas fulva]